MSARYVRPLSPFERMWIAGQTSCGFILLEGSGELSAARLRRAVETASRVNPGSRIALRGHGPWSRWEEVHALPSVEEVDGSDWDGCTGEHAPFSDQVHMDVRRAPSLSYVLIHGDTPRLTIIQRTHHATMDGLGGLRFLQDVFRALRDEPLLGANGIETDLELARRLGGRRRQISNDCLKPYPGISTGIPGSTWQRLRVTGKMRPQPLARAILTIASIARRHGAGDVLIDLPVNLRQQFPEVRNTGNLTGSLRLAIAPDATLESITTDIATQVAAGRHADALVSAASMRYLPLGLMRRVARQQALAAVRQGRFTPTAVVSNLGRFDPSAYSAAEFQAHSATLIPPAYDGVPLFLVLSGCDDGFDLAARAPQALAGDGRLKALLEEIATATAQ